MRASRPGVVSPGAVAYLEVALKSLQFLALFCEIPDAASSQRTRAYRVANRPPRTFEDFRGRRKADGLHR